MGAGQKVSVYLVQQGVWDMPLESMPLAAGYLKAMALQDPQVREAVDIKTFNYRGGDTITKMAADIFADGPPDILACSILGWNYRAFCSLAEAFKQLNPDGWAIFGGTHVANQAQRLFRIAPEVDVVVNGEGELTFVDLLKSRLAGTSRRQLADVAGISYQGPDGETLTTAERERMENLDIVPSPVLTGAIDLTNEAGQFRYDVALMETNRGCPYKCAFCYWGGAIGQRVRAFSRERLRAELEVFASLKVHTICLCDANFGLMKIDEEFIDDVIEIRARTGYPKAIESSWAKNKSKVFYSIVRKMKDAGLRSSFTLALQTLDDNTLSMMNRKNMKVNDWEDLVAWLNAEELECYAELIWGAPGETVESFLRGYDRLSTYVSRIATYPILMLPNTDYSEKRQEYGIVSVRGDHDDFEYVLSHNTMSMADNKFMQRFLFWSRVLGDAAILRYSWPALRILGGMTQSQVVRNIDSWLERTDDPGAAVLRETVTQATDAPGRAIDYLYREADAKDLLRRWWDESIKPLLPAEHQEVLTEIFRYDLLTHPVCRPDGATLPAGISTVSLGKDEHYLRAGVPLRYDVPSIVSQLRAGETPEVKPKPMNIDLYYRIGVEDFITTMNSEEIIYFMGRTKDDVFGADAALAPVSADGPYTALLRSTGGCG